MIHMNVCLEMVPLSDFLWIWLRFTGILSHTAIENEVTSEKNFKLIYISFILFQRYGLMLFWVNINRILM